MTELNLLGLLIYALATFRVTNMIVFERGPFDVFVWFRQAGEPFTCFWCASVWVGFGSVLLRAAATEMSDLVAFAFALSALAIGMKSAAEAWMDFVQSVTKGS